MDSKVFLKAQNDSIHKARKMVPITWRASSFLVFLGNRGQNKNNRPINLTKVISPQITITPPKPNLYHTQLYMNST